MKITVDETPPVYKNRDVRIWQLAGQFPVILLDLKNGKQMVIRHYNENYPPGHIGSWFDKPKSPWEPFEGTITLSNDE